MSLSISCFSCRRRNFSDFDDDFALRISRSSEYGSRRSSTSSKGRDENGSQKSDVARSFTFRELSKATRNFAEVNMIGEGGFGRVYKGNLEGQTVAIKQLNLDGLQGNQEFCVEVLMLSLLHHPNLVTLTGYCSSGDQRLLVYEYMPNGCLEDHLFDLEPEKEPLSWNTRMKIAVGSARGLEYLHCKASPPVIYRDLKSANILLDENFNPKLSDFGLAKLGPVGDKTHVSTRVMGTYGYCAPEYAMSGKLTLKSDIYSFGVVLLELISGRKVIDLNKKPGQQNLLVWSRPLLKDRRKFIQLVDPSLQGRFPVRSLYQVIAITAMCLNDQANSRPFVGDIVVALEYVASQLKDETHSSVPCSPSSPSPSPSPSPSRFQRGKGSMARSQTFGNFTSA